MQNLCKLIVLSFFLHLYLMKQSHIAVAPQSTPPPSSCKIYSITHCWVFKVYNEKCLHGTETTSQLMRVIGLMKQSLWACSGSRFESTATTSLWHMSKCSFVSEAMHSSRRWSARFLIQQVIRIISVFWSDVAIGRTMVEEVALKKAGGMVKFRLNFGLSVLTKKCSEWTESTVTSE